MIKRTVSFLFFILLVNSLKAGEPEFPNADTGYRPAASSMGSDAIRWIELQGVVTQVSLADRVVQIEDAYTRKPIEIPITSKIKIFDKKKREWLLGDLRRGQRVIVRNEQFNQPIVSAQP